MSEPYADSEILRDYLGRIRLSGDLLLDLINDTLLVSKINNGKLEINREPVNTEDIKNVLIAAISTEAAKKGVIFTIDDSGLRPRTVMADN